MRQQEASEEDLSLLRVVIFLLRYRWSIIVLPVLGFVVAAGFTRLTADRLYTAEATVRVPRVDSSTLASYESLFRSAEVLSVVERSGQAEAPSVLQPETLRQRLQVSRSGDLLTVSLALPSESLATIGLRHAIDTASAIYSERSLQSERQLEIDTTEIAEARRALADLEDQIVSVFQEYGSVDLGSDSYTERSLTALAARPETGLEAAASFEFATLQPQLSRSRNRLRKLLVRAARSGAIDEARARTEAQAARDSVRAWLNRQGDDALSASERFRYQTLLWRVELWQEVLEATDQSPEPQLEPVVVAEPTVASVTSPKPVQNGVLGALGAGLLAFIWGLLREAVRRGKELRSAPYRDFRDLVSSTRTLSWKGLRWLRGEPEEE